MAKTGKKKDSTQASATAKQRRALLKKLGRFAAVSAPTVTLLLAAKAKPGAAFVPSCAPSSRAFKTRIGPVNRTKVLAGISALPIKARRG